MKTKKQALLNMKKYFTEMKETCEHMLEHIEKELKKQRGKKK
jgi:Na+/phosphate symporter